VLPLAGTECDLALDLLAGTQQVKAFPQEMDSNSPGERTRSNVWSQKKSNSDSEDEVDNSDTGLMLRNRHEVYGQPKRDEEQWHWT